MPPAGEGESAEPLFADLSLERGVLTARLVGPSIGQREGEVIAGMIQKKLQGTEPAKQASKGQRPVFQKGQWHDAQLFEMSELRPGNEINGLAVIEAPNTTLFLPQEWQVRIDEYEIYWLEKRHGNK